MSRQFASNFWSPQGAIETLLVVHTMQVREDTNTRGSLEGTSFRRAMFSAYDGNQSFLNEQKVMAEELKSLRGANVNPLKSSDLPVVALAEKPKRFLVKPTDGNTCSGDDEVEFLFSGIRTMTLAEHLTPSADKEVGYYRVGLASCEGKDLAATWNGQFLCKVDARKKSLEILIYKFKPEFTDDCLADLQSNNMSKGLKAEMQKNLSRYELSRQFLINLPLSDIRRFCLNAPNGMSGHGFLIIECSSQMKFTQRHIATNLSHHNKWKQRGSIFGENVSAAQHFLVLGSSNCRDLAIIVAQIILMEPKLKELYVEEDQVLLPEHPLPGVAVLDGGAEACSAAACNGAMDEQQREGPPRKKFKIFSKKAKLRKEILDMLVLLNIVTREKANEVYANPQNLEEENVRNKSKINNHLGGLGLQICFNEFLNFECDNAKTIEIMVHQKLRAADYGHESFAAIGVDEDEFEKEEDDTKKEALNNVTALDLLQKQKDQGEPVFFSYCRDEIDQANCTFHCTRCHECRDWREWHCYNCDNCSYGLSIPQCDNCGVRNDEYATRDPLLNGSKPIVRPEFLKNNNLKRTLKRFRRNHPPMSEDMHCLSDSDDSCDDDDFFYSGSVEERRSRLSEESRLREENLKGWVFSENEDDVLSSPLDI